MAERTLSALADSSQVGVCWLGDCMLVIGKKEEDSESVAVRKRSGEQSFGVKFGSFVDEVKQKTAAFE